tara:strand:- start:517 stop:1170 length:654 start_codon:yes stop_codon:yes gene_type:complete
MSKEVLKISNLNYDIEKKIILKNINLSLIEGEFISIMGPSGSGKTSLLRVISGLSKQTTGEILIEGKLVASDQTFIETENRNIGLVVQDKVLFPHLTVLDNIKFGINNRDISIKKITAMMSKFKIEDLQDQYPHELSGGEGQRVALARTLITNPKILLLDEPFNGLDDKLKSEIYPDIQSILEENKVTTIMVSHNNEEVQELSHRNFKLLDHKLEET